MNKAATACIDSHMVDVKTVDAEKNQVTRGQRIQANRPCRELLFTRRPWDFDADSLVRVNGEAATVKALEIGATEVIRRADELGSRAGHGSSAIASRLLRLAGNAATRCQKQHQDHRGNSIAQESSLTPIPRGSSGQPASRMSLICESVLIVRAWRSSVTACPESGLARKKP